MTDEKCKRCGYPISKTNQFIVLNDETYCMGCYQLITNFRDDES